MDAQEISSDLCGLDGPEHESPTRAEFNKFVRVVNYYHGRPIKHDLRQLKDMTEAGIRTLNEHIEQDKLFYAKLSGAKWVIYAIAAMLAFLVPLLFQLINALKALNII